MNLYMISYKHKQHHVGYCPTVAMATGSRGYKNQVRLRGLTKYQGFLTRAGGFCLCSCGFNRPINVKLTPMKALRLHHVSRLGVSPGSAIALQHQVIALRVTQILNLLGFAN